MAGISISSSYGGWSPLSALRQSQKEMASAMERLATGKRINRASDDPADVGAIAVLTGDAASALEEIRALERGWRYSAAILEAAGAAPLVEGADPKEWLDLWLPALTRKLRHPGNLRYGWGLQRKVWAVMPPAQDYPKKPKPTTQPTETP